MLSQLRPWISPLKSFLARPFVSMGVSATTLGFVGVLLALGAAVSVRLGLPRVAFGLALLALATDLIDGEVARLSKTCTPLGNYIDAMGDRTRECLLLLGLLWTAPDLVALAIVGTCLTSFAKARCALVLTMDNRDWPGFGDHPDRAALILWAYFVQPASLLPLSILALATWVACVRRFLFARSLIEEAPSELLQPYLREPDAPVSSLYHRKK